MYFLIDGYNLLFSWHHGKEERGRFVQWIQHEFQRTQLQGMIIFDGAHQRGEESGLSYPSPLVVAFTSKGQSADEYILEVLQKNMTVVTNDQGLKRHVRDFGAKIMSNAAFLEWLLKKRKKKKVKEPKESPQQVERLLKIFEEKLKEGRE